MSRIRIELPAAFLFTAEIPVRITDLNYGGHVGNDAILSLIHEARMQYLASLGYSELQFAGVSLIMSDAGIEFKNEAFYGDTLRVSVTAADASRVGFSLFYKLEKSSEGKMVLVASAKTGMICYNYETRKVTPLPEEAKQKMGL